MRGIADTGFLVAFGNRNDVHHRWAVEIAKTLTEPLLTCEAVIAEAAFHLKATNYVLTLIDTGLVTLAFDANKELEHLNRLAVRYEDRTPDFADLCIIRMSEIYPKHTVITIDEIDFSVYRRNKRDAIPLLTPGRKTKR